MLLAGGLVTLLLGISKGQSWGWTSALDAVDVRFVVVILAVFGWWELRVASPIVDLRTTVKRPVLTTNVASIAVAFGMFALSYVAPQILETADGDWLTGWRSRCCGPGCGWRRAGWR